MLSLVLVCSILLVVLGIKYQKSEQDDIFNTEREKKEREEIEDPINSIYQSIVIVQDTTTNDLTGYGTGFIIGENKLLTNVHVISDPTANSGEKINPNLSVRIKNENGEFVDFKVKNITLAPNKADLALVEVYPTDDGQNIHDNMNILEFATQEEINNVKVGDVVHTIGYPADKEYGTLWKSEGDVTFLDDANFVAFNATIYGGNSGSPLLNEDGKIIGLSNGGNKNIACGFLLSEDLYEFIQSNID